ncbi:MAG: TauD/TfdA family dioxygenase [Deltaproteobacteria bacterium]|nr:TauD/TfdA family dioxygenase [Deltaproteobacteria bacterium]
MSDDHGSLLHVVRADGAATSLDHLGALLSSRAEDLQNKLFLHGGLLFRGFDVESPTHFKRVLSDIFPGSMLQPYVGGVGFKRRVSSAVYTSTEVPASLTISPHNELAYLPGAPPFVSFFCQQPASSGGRTSLVCGKALYEQMPRSIRESFESKGIKYSRVYRPPGLARRFGIQHPLAVSWSDVFESDDPSEVERRCLEKALTVRWRDGGVLETSIVLPAVIKHPKTNAPLSFNQAHTFLPTPASVGQFLYGIYKFLWLFPSLRQGEAWFGTGEKIPMSVVDEIHTTIKQHQRFVEWQRGDVLVLDNYRLLHGREAYRGKRKVFAAML